MTKRVPTIMFSVLTLALAAVALPKRGNAAPAQPLRVCADPGNMPFSNEDGEGIENKLAEVLAKSLGARVQYYYRPTIERGMTRTTLDADQCDVMMDMPTDSERVLLTSPVYRTTFVLAYRTDRNLHIKNLDDPQLRKLKVGVYQTSAIREALLDHGVIDNVYIHYLSHDADLVPEDAPSYQVQQVVDGKLDIAAAWGPFAGWYKAKKGAPITIQPANLWEDDVPLEFSMALAVRNNDKELRDRLENALHEQRDAIQAILVEFGVPLVKCDECLVSGELPSHGPYRPVQPKPEPAATKPVVTIAMLDEWLKHGANVNTELNNAVIADDQVRVGYLLEKKHADINALDPQGETPLQHALLIRSMPMVQFLLKHGAGVTVLDRDGWTPIMTAAWADQPEAIKALVAQHADPNFIGPGNLTPLGIAMQYRKDAALQALIDVGADISKPIGEAGYTPLMLAVAGHSDAALQALIKKGANVNASNAGGVTALMIAAADGQADLVQQLLRAGANAAAQSERGDTALSIARDKGHLSVVRLLDGGQDSAASNPAHSGG